ncbi:hypothetical protein [Antrihabitans cavernicola]|uniref:Low molecular weight antigen MTB12-like C-terminal domain-containing protein n=1 Tax=Antrihabitans cavernicola TaxID=2495913 RepID=A0A5A7SHF3_9NOCA|nr:hypothetical protein [Spelaeibacter cavernicola]KAA0023621.1 hypothetical protein FOY51_09555 [Spelaeibacter cavernicola]
MTRRMRRLEAALICLATVSAFAACGSDDAGTAAPTSTTSVADVTGTGPPIPTAAELDAHIKAALNRDLPDDQRVDLIEDGDAFRSSIPDLYKALNDNPNAKYMVVDPVFDNHDGTLTATFKLDKDGSGTAIRTATVHFVAVDGKWKISRTDLCGILRTADYHTPACG